MTGTPAQLVGATVDQHGTAVADTTGLRDNAYRLPSFLALARETGGLYAENLTGMDVGQALTAAGLDFTVTKAEGLSVEHGNTRVTGLPRLRGTVATFPDSRPPQLLGVVGEKYPVVQPWEAAEFGQAVVEEGGANVAAIGAYGDPVGSRMFIALRLPDGLKIGGQDAHDLYLGLGNSWDRSTALWAVAAPIRVNCTNQFAATFGALSNRFAIPHRGDMGYKVSEVQRALDLTGLFSAEYARTAEKLLAAPMVGAEIDAFVDRLMPTPDRIGTDRGALSWEIKRRTVVDLIRRGENNTFGVGTRYAAMQGVVEYVDWMSPAKNPRTRATRTVDGGHHEQLKSTAVSMLLAGV